MKVYNSLVLGQEYNKFSRQLKLKKEQKNLINSL